MRLLVVEDDPLLGDGLAAGLRQGGYAVDWVTDGVAAAHALEVEAFDAVVLDLGLPRRTGLDVLHGLRRAGNDIPVLILTARDGVADRVYGLDAGADDYMVKPFDLDELTARVRVLLRRRAGRAAPLLRHGPIELDPARRTVTLDGRPVEVSRREFSVLETLLENAGRVVAQEALEQRLYGWGEAVGSNAIQVHVHHLRRKLGAELIRTVRGIGYAVRRVP